MATLTLTYPFATTVEGWADMNTTATREYDASYGNPSGSLKERLQGRNKTDTGGWRLEGTWEDLGVPSGATVTHIRLEGCDYRCTDYSAVDSATDLIVKLQNSIYVDQATMHSGVSITAAHGSWQSLGAQSDQAVPAGLQASTSSICIFTGVNLDLANDGGAAITLYDDNVEIVITYETASSFPPVPDAQRLRRTPLIRM